MSYPRVQGKLELVELDLSDGIPTDVLGPPAFQRTY